MRIEVPDIPAWGMRDCLDGERRSLGFCLSGHPFDECRHEARSFTGGSLREILDRAQPGRPEERNDSVIVVAGSVLRKWRRAGANYFDLDDGQTRLPVRLPRWDSGAPPARLITPHSLVLVKGRVSRLQRGSINMYADSVESLEEAMEQRARLLLLHCEAESDPAETFEELRELLQGHMPGATEVVIEYAGKEAAGRLRLGPNWKVSATADLRSALSQSSVVHDFQFRYAGAA